MFTCQVEYGQSERADTFPCGELLTLRLWPTNNLSRHSACSEVERVDAQRRFVASPLAICAGVFFFPAALIGFIFGTVDTFVTLPVTSDLGQKGVVTAARAWLEGVGCGEIGRKCVARHIGVARAIHGNAPGQYRHYSRPSRSSTPGPNRWR